MTVKLAPGKKCGNACILNAITVDAPIELVSKPINAEPTAANWEWEALALNTEAEALMEKAIRLQAEADELRRWARQFRACHQCWRQPPDLPQFAWQ